MKLIGLFILASTIALAQVPLMSAQNDPEVATLCGKTWKKSEIETMVNAVGGAPRANYTANPKAFLETFAMVCRLADIAKEKGYDKRQPFASVIFFNEMQMLSIAATNGYEQDIIITPDAQKAYFEAHKAEFRSPKMKMVVIRTKTPDHPNGHHLSEADDLSKSITAKARAGQDFLQLVNQFSEDEVSKGKGGDAVGINVLDPNFPPQARAALLQMKPGDITEPIRLPRGFYVFRVDGFEESSYEQVRDDIYMRLRQERFTQWMEDIKKNSTKIDYKDPNPPAGAAQHP